MTARRHVLIVEARFYPDIADELAAGATAELVRGQATWARHAVPGAFELPAAIAFALRASAGGSQAPTYDGFIALGCVIQGETDHYDHICREVSRALMDLTIDAGVPLGFGLLTCRDRNQAWQRAAVTGKNKGADAAAACLVMMDLKRQHGPVLR